MPIRTRCRGQHYDGGFDLHVERYGNTSSASVPLALYEARQEKKFKRGSYVLMVGYGAGLTWGSALMRW